MSTITIPDPISKEINLRWFVEYVVDHSILFKTTSAIAKATALLNTDLDTPGATVDLPEAGHKLLRAALTNDDSPLEMPILEAKQLDDKGEPIGDSVKLPPRLLSRFVAALVQE